MNTRLLSKKNTIISSLNNYLLNPATLARPSFTFVAREFLYLMRELEGPLSCWADLCFYRWETHEGRLSAVITSSGIRIPEELQPLAALATLLNRDPWEGSVPFSELREQLRNATDEYQALKLADLVNSSFERSSALQEALSAAALKRWSHLDLTEVLAGNVATRMQLKSLPLALQKEAYVLLAENYRVNACGLSDARVLYGTGPASLPRIMTVFIPFVKESGIPPQVLFEATVADLPRQFGLGEFWIQRTPEGPGKALSERVEVLNQFLSAMNGGNLAAWVAAGPNREAKRNRALVVAPLWTKSGEAAFIGTLNMEAALSAPQAVGIELFGQFYALAANADTHEKFKVAFEKAEPWMKLLMMVGIHRRLAGDALLRSK